MLMSLLHTYKKQRKETTIGQDYALATQTKDLLCLGMMQSIEKECG
tara:strand:- start:397 stop:534 length:138 start_codon:yes stop_codon:yes gene_type:complete